MREIKRLILHHTATPQDTTVASIRNYHVNDLGWSDIGYHYLVDYTGKIYTGRPVERQGAHARGNNENSIGIVVIGNYDKSALSCESRRALGVLVSYMEYRFGELGILGHREVGRTVCPGIYLMEWIDWRNNGREWGLL